MKDLVIISGDMVSTTIDYNLRQRILWAEEYDVGLLVESRNRTDIDANTIHIVRRTRCIVRNTRRRLALTQKI